MSYYNRDHDYDENRPFTPRSRGWDQGRGWGRGYGQGWGRGPHRFRRPVRPQFPWGQYHYRRPMRPPYYRPFNQQQSICRIVRQILIANPQLAAPIQEALMRHGITCAELTIGGQYGYGYPMSNQNQNYQIARSNYASGGCNCG